MSNESLMLGSGNWAAKTNNLLGYVVGDISAQFTPREFTFSRGSTATFTNPAGVIQSSASGIARVQNNALLLEPQRTNSMLYSEQFDNASWVKVDTSVTANTTTSPDGTTNADSLIENTATALHQISQGTFSVGGVYTASIYAKKNGRNWIFLNIASASNYGAWFDIDSGVLGTVQANITNTTITNVGNGWYRCSVTANTGALSPRLSLTMATANSVISYTGNGTSGIFIWGAQIEAGSYPTTYIPTTNATATRLADSFSISNVFTNGWISSLGGTWFVELRGNIVYTRDTAGYGLAISDQSNPSIGAGASGNTLAIIRTSTSSVRLQVVKQESLTLTALYTTTTDTTKIAIKWNGSTADVFVNGTKQVSATTFTATSMQHLIGLATDVPKFIQAMALYPTPLSDADCQTLTT